MGRDEANIRKKFLGGKALVAKSSKVDQKRQRNDRKGDGVRTRVSFQRANRLGNKHPVRTIFETETLCAFITVMVKRALRTIYAACNRAGELFEPRVTGSNQGKWF